jgi:hypothetical protein
MQIKRARTHGQEENHKDADGSNSNSNKRVRFETVEENNDDSDEDEESDEYDSTSVDSDSSDLEDDYRHPDSKIKWGPGWFWSTTKKSGLNLLSFLTEKGSNLVKIYFKSDAKDMSPDNTTLIPKLTVSLPKLKSIDVSHSGILNYDGVLDQIIRATGGGLKSIKLCYQVRTSVI